MSETLTAADMAAPEPEVVETPAPEGQAPEAQPEPQTEAQPEKPKHERWFHQRLRAQNAKIADLGEHGKRIAQELEIARAALARYEAQQRGQSPQDNTPGQHPQTQAGLTERDVESRAAALAAQRAEAADFTSRSNAVYEAGTQAYPDFAEKLGQFENLGGLGQHIEFVKDVIDLPNGAQVLYALANDLDQAAHVLALPPRRQAMALATLSSNLASSHPATSVAQVAAAPAPAVVVASKAPPPIRPIVGKAAQGPSDIYDKNISMEQFIKMRSKK